MAEKITVLRSSEESYGTINRTVMFWYPLSPVVQDSRGNTVVLQNRNTIRDANVLLYLAAADLDALDAGAAAYEVLNLQQTAGETNAAFRTRALANHAARGALWIASRRNEYAIAGLAVST
jgi:hypothetical protein